MKKAICLFFTWCCTLALKAQFSISCGEQNFNITAKKLSPLIQVDASAKTGTTTTYYYALTHNKLQVWLQTADSQTRSFTLYEIAKQAIDTNISGEIAEYDQQEYTRPVKTLYIKCTAGKKEVAVTGYVDWTVKPDIFSWSFINISSYDKTELENLQKEINTC